MGFPDSSVGKEFTCNAGDPSLIPGSGRSTGEGIDYPLQYSWVSAVVQLAKNPPAMWETWIWCLGWEDPLEKGKVSIPVFCPGEFHGLFSQWGCKESNMTEQLSLARNTCWLTQHGVVLEKSFEVLRMWVRISDFLFSIIWPTRII